MKRAVKKAAPAWDALIIGGGPAGLAAGLHLARAGYATLLAERRRYGGQAASIGRLENYPGHRRVSGAALMKTWLAQARGWRLNARLDEALSVSKKDGVFRVRLRKAGTVRARTLLWCGGAGFRALGVPGERGLAGKLVWNTADEAPSLAGRTAVVIGGGEAAVQQAAALAAGAAKVFIVSRGAGLKAHRLLLERLRAAGAEHLPGREVTKIGPRGPLLRGADGEDLELRADAVFVLIGKEPRRVPAAWRAAPAGFFAAGDAACGLYRQVAVAAGDGVRAAMSAIRYLEGT